MEFSVMYAGTIPQISPTFGKIPHEYPGGFWKVTKILVMSSKFRIFRQNFGNIVKIPKISTKFREFGQNFGNLDWKFQWIFQWFECSNTETLWIFQFTEILWNSSDSHWNSEPSLSVYQQDSLEMTEMVDVYIHVFKTV